MKQAAKTAANRIDELSNNWEARKQGFINTYGPAVLTDREFLKANRDTYQSILQNYPYKQLSFDEKISYRIMRGQRRHLNRVIYPNALVRATRNILVAVFRAGRKTISLAGRIANNILKITTNTNGITARRPQPNRSLLRQPALQTRVGPIKTAGKNAEAITATQVIAPELQATRSAATNQKVEKLIPKRFTEPRMVLNNTRKEGQTI